MDVASTWMENYGYFDIIWLVSIFVRKCISRKTGTEEIVVQRGQIKHEEICYFSEQEYKSVV